eukprot:TRINITY_DN73158_c0_g1_i1.p1 TRINITY_DN73158_c0_g1~~TRINITY_DN73158_c0_g1_i1.p1  ORF type:complete len:102 (-),score=8.37 TRINITY_DN73158_c0_g1_i1:166-471(-)
MHTPRTVSDSSLPNIESTFKRTFGQGILYSKHGNINIEIIDILTNVGWDGFKTLEINHWILCTGVEIWFHRRVNKHTIVALSSSEAEHRLMACGTCELLMQ